MWYVDYSSILFSFMGYFNGHSKSVVVMIAGLIQAIVIRLPLSYYMSIQPDASLTAVGLAVPIATVFGIIYGIVYYLYLQGQIKKGVSFIKN